LSFKREVLPALVPKAICVGCNRELNCVLSNLPFPSLMLETALCAVYVKAFA
jgi:hypothetical protein